MDFKPIKMMLEKRLISTDKILTEDNKKIIEELHSLYSLSHLDIEKVILSSITNENTLDVAELKKACRDLVELREEQLRHRFEALSPKQLLEDLSSNNQASATELKLINDIMKKHGLPSSVMNVLIHYVLIQSNMKLPKAYMDTIASHWSRAGLKNAKEAMDFARREVQKYNKRSSRTKSKIEISQDQKADEKPFTTYEYRYMEKLYDQYNMSFDVTREIIRYGRKVNNNLLIYWFLDGVSDYIHRNKGKTADLLKDFHKKYVEEFGKES